MDLIRHILDQVERRPQAQGMFELTTGGASPEEASYHVMLLHDAGLLKAVDCSSMEGLCWKPVHLTWEGHEFLDAARNDTAWDKIKSQIKEKGVPIPFEVLKALLVQYARDLFLPS